jgi:hypothetical protein
LTVVGCWCRIRKRKGITMRYSDDYDQYDYDYDELVENADDLGLDEEPWMDGNEDNEVPSYGKNYYPDISEKDNN